MNLSHILEQFNLAGEPSTLPGGSHRTFRVGRVVLKHIHETSLENNHSPELAAWIAEFSNELPQEGFRVPKPVATREGQWIMPDGWTAWTFVEGTHATAKDIPTCIAGIIAFHRALKQVAKNPWMDDNRAAWGKADRWCWGDEPEEVQPLLRPYVEKLYALRQPVRGLPEQLIHGDLNPENILVGPGLTPAFIDLSPFWRPVEFALGMFANWIGPRQGDASALDYFQDIREFDQMLVRAGIRMLLIMSVLDKLEDWETCSEKRAAEIIIDYVENKKGDLK